MGWDPGGSALRWPRAQVCPTATRVFGVEVRTEGKVRIQRKATQTRTFPVYELRTYLPKIGLSLFPGLMAPVRILVKVRWQLLHFDNKTAQFLVAEEGHAPAALVVGTVN